MTDRQRGLAAYAGPLFVMQLFEPVRRDERDGEQQECDPKARHEFLLRDLHVVGDVQQKRSKERINVFDHYFT